MKILFTGASSLTGMWFLKELSDQGHEVSALFLREKSEYESIKEGFRSARVSQCLACCKPFFGCSFGSDAFIKIIREEGPWDLFCHHAADVADYKSPLFDPAAALQKNACNVRPVLESLMEQGCRHMVLTGSVFEPNEGAGSDGLRAVSPYGLSKGLTSELFRYYTASLGFRLGKFVIPNPFGPYEEPRYTTYLVSQWAKGMVPKVATPAYVRDNIPVSLLAKSYARFACDLVNKPVPGFEKINPSFYVDSQAAFTERFAKEMQKRLSIPCPFETMQQNDFPEPKIRINTDPLDARSLGWAEDKAWDGLAEFYNKCLLGKVGAGCG